MSRYRKVVAVAAIAGVLCLVALLVAFQADIGIAYHRQRMVSAWHKAIEVGAGPKQGDFLEAYDRHKASLVTLGYLERREFPLQHVSVPSLQSRHLWEELRATFPDHIHIEMPWYGHTVVVWDRPQNLAAWEAIINAHDRPVKVQ